MKAREDIRPLTENEKTKEKKEKIIRRGNIKIKIMENEEGISISNDKEMPLINISGFKKDIPLETFATDVESQIINDIEEVRKMMFWGPYGSFSIEKGTFELDWNKQNMAFFK